MLVVSVKLIASYRDVRIHGPAICPQSVVWTAPLIIDVPAGEEELNCSVACQLLVVLTVPLIIYLPAGNDQLHG